ncbi:MAG: tryptophan-rich sensory protein [Alphaproteobacteria bacterium]
MLVRNSVLVSLGVCGLAATAEGILSGKQPMQVLATFHLPRFTPPRWAWIVIGLLYYGICFTVLTRLLQMDDASSLQGSAIVLMIVLLGLNAVFNYLLFGLRNLLAALVVFIPYDLIAVALQVCLFRLDNATGYIFVSYIVYLVFASVWGYRLWRLNRAHLPES